jgi:hypothetical protein
MIATERMTDAEFDSIALDILLRELGPDGLAIAANSLPQCVKSQGTWGKIPQVALTIFFKKRRRAFAQSESGNTMTSEGGGR